MKILLLPLAILFLLIPIKSQEAKPQTVKSQPLPEWFRVYTYDDSIIELNTNYIMFSSRKIERVRFRWSFQTLQTLSGNPDIKYQSVLEEIQFDCRNGDFRFYSLEWYGADGNLVASKIPQESEDWRPIKFGSTMEKLFTPACKLIELRKREPSSEK